AVWVSPTIAYCSMREGTRRKLSALVARIVISSTRAPGDLDEREAKLRERLTQRLLMAIEPLTETFDERGDAVDRQPGLVEVGRHALVGGEGKKGELPQADRVVGDDVRHRRGRELLAQLPQLLAGGLVVGPGAAAVVRGRLVSTVRLVLTARRPKGAHADILT